MGISSVGEGVVFGNKRYRSISSVETLDLVSEGEIEGLVSRHWKLYGNIGDVGFDADKSQPVDFNGIVGYTNSAQWRSVYWNEVPVIDEGGKLNFQNVEVTGVWGNPSGDLAGDLGNIGTNLSVSRTVGERLRGGSSNAKYYRIYNKDCIGIKVNIRVLQLSVSYQDGNSFSTVDAETSVSVSAAPMFSTATLDQFGYGGQSTDTQIDQSQLLDPTTQTSSYPINKTTVIKGMITQGFLYPIEVNFDTKYADIKDFIGWRIKIVKNDDDKIDYWHKNSLSIDSYTEVYGTRFSYPGAAIVCSRFSAEFFASVPERAFDLKLVKVKVPNCYHPATRSYDKDVDGNIIWDGQFKEQKEWTDNPAWCYYDLLTNKRYGLGNYFDSNSVQKFYLFEVAKYCDTLVADGYGGIEPRFSCNLIINTREEAYKVVNDFASIFNAITYYQGGGIRVVQDRPKDPIVTFTNANVKEGEFQYASSSRRVRDTVAVVRYNDPKNLFKPTVEYVEDIDGVRRYGVRQVDLTAYGCTSRGQAVRFGRWALLSETVQTETVSFTAGTEALTLQPGDVFKTFDAFRKTSNYAGRTTSAIHLDGNPVFTLDRQISVDSAASYRFSVLTPTFDLSVTGISDMTSADSPDIRRSHLQTQTILGSQVHQVGNYSQIWCNAGMDTSNYYIGPNQIWTLEEAAPSNNFASFRNSIISGYDYYTVVRIQEKENNQFEIAGLQYFPDKYLEIESGLNFQRDQAAFEPDPTAPTALALSISAVPGSDNISFSVIMDNGTEGVTSYRVYMRTTPFDSDQIPPETPTSYVQSADVPAPEPGTYYFRAYSYNDNTNKYSATFVYGSIEATTSRQIHGVQISIYQVQDSDGTILSPNSTSIGINRYTSYSVSPTVFWQVGYANNTAPSDWTYRITIREPSADGIPSSTIYAEYTTTSTAGLQNYQFLMDDNLDISGGPYRDYDFVIEAVDSDGYTSAGNSVSPAPFAEGGWLNYPQGYGIVRITNDKVAAVSFTAPIGYSTDQWIDSSNRVNIAIKDGYPVPKDIAGAVIFLSDVSFTAADVLANLPSIKRNDVSVVYGQKSIVSQDTISLGVVAGYASVAFYDTFDLLSKENIADIVPNLNIADPIQVDRLVVGNHASFYGSVRVSDPANTAEFASETVERDIVNNAYKVFIKPPGTNEKAIVSTSR